jgi:hypothetical protein
LASVKNVSSGVVGANSFFAASVRSAVCCSAVACAKGLPNCAVLAASSAAMPSVQAFFA